MATKNGFDGGKEREGGAGELSTTYLRRDRIGQATVNERMKAFFCFQEIQLDRLNGLPVAMIARQIESNVYFGSVQPASQPFQDTGGGWHWIEMGFVKSHSDIVLPIN